MALKTRLLKQRLDTLLVARGFFETREKARRSIMAGEVKVGERVVDKTSALVTEDVGIAVAAAPRYVSRGGLKLEAALDHFGIDPGGRVCLDIGASTGGFTDCLLQRGAARVYAIDVGHGQLNWKIRNDPRVVVREKVNARFLSRAEVLDEIDICTIDVSFISLTLILPPAFELLNRDGVIVALVKPQFELSRQDVGKGGIVRDAALHTRAVSKIETFVRENMKKSWGGFIESPITGADGNKEFLTCLRN
jgi:23S rRNA (cytidine1920-2'-O)/16S rRNA (cytidine1409-2'-O)-methyltransferase